MERDDGDEEYYQDDDDGDDDGEEGDEDQDDTNDHDLRADTIEHSLFEGQDPKKIARIMKNLLGLGDKDREIQRQIALREANHTVYTDICTVLLVTYDDTLPKYDLHNLVVGAVRSFFS